MTMKVSGDLVRQLRLERGWTQEHLATVAETSVKTIQRVESSGICSLETRSALSAVFQVEAKQLDGEEKIEQAKAQSDSGIIYYHRLLTGNSIVDVFNGAYWYRFTNEDARTPDEVDTIAAAVQSIHDWAEIWGDIEPGSKIKATFELGELLKDLESHGLWLFGLRTKTMFKLAQRDGGSTAIDGAVSNFHVAYADSDQVIVLDPRACA